MGARYSAPVKTGPGAHPASYTMGTGSFPGVKRRGHGVEHPPPSSAEVKKRVELYIYSPWVFVACSGVDFTFTVTAHYLTRTEMKTQHIQVVISPVALTPQLQNLASQGQNARCVVWHNDSKYAATVQTIFCTKFVREPPTNMPIYKWDNLFMRLVAFELKHATATTSRGVLHSKTRDGLNPKFNLTSWAAKYNIILPRPSIFVNFSKQKNGRA